MDIDEFLDRELSALDLQTGKAEKQQPEPMQYGPQALAETDISPLVENIGSSLKRGNLDEAEQSYVQLWSLLLQQKLKWDKELHDQLLVLGRQFSASLEQAYTGVKSAAQQITEKISKARSLLKEGKKEVPFKTYNEIQEINSLIPNVFFEQKRVVQSQINDFYKELVNTTDNELIRRVSNLIQEMYSFLDRTNNSIRSGNMLDAIACYHRCVELYVQIPEGFLRYKNAIGLRILDVYKNLSIYTEISNLQKQLQQNISLQKNEEKRVLAREMPSGPDTAKAKKENAIRNMEQGLYAAASKDIQDAINLEPKDAEAKVIHARIKTLM